MKDNRGMTLIEVVISLLIVSTASLIMVIGFNTTINMFSSANSYKNSVNDEVSALKGDLVVKDNLTKTTESAKYIIKDENNVEVVGEVSKVSSNDDKSSLSLFEIVDEDDNK